MHHDPSFRLNGQPASLADAAPTETLLRWLHRHRLAGSKEGCGDGDCGACTVVLVDTDRDGRRTFQAVNSCLLPVGQLVGRELLTVEALAEGGHLHPVQQALVDSAGSQCGYCTPGFVMSLFAGYYAGQLDDATTEGNLCRCTGYRSIRAATATLAAAPAADDRFRALLQDASPPLPASEIDGLFNPTSIDAALQLKQAHPDAAWLCGATDLGVELSRGRGGTRRYIAVDRITALQTLECSDDSVRIGAAVPLSRIERELHGVFPSLDTMLHGFAARQVKNRATIGGNLGSASPIGDLAPVLLALDAEVECHGPAGVRRLPIERFFVDYRRTVRADDELIVAVTVPRRGFVDAACKVAKRQTDDISIVAAAFALGLDHEQRVQHVRLAYGGVAAVPLRATAVEAFLLGRRLDADTVAAACAQLHDVFAPLSDHRAGADYRRALAANLFAGFVEQQLGATA
jgi:xanthine dehydrogenase small subunit